MSVFKQIPSIANYAVSPFGELVHVSKFGISKLYNNKNSNGKITCVINGLTYRMDKLVAETWITNVNQYKYVKHLDGDLSNNDVSNLVWCEFDQK